MLKRVAAFVILAGLLGLGLLASQWRERPAKVTGVVEADEIRIGSRVGGRVAKVFFAEGAMVEEALSPVVELEPHDWNAREREAEALVRAGELRLKRLRRGARDEEIRQAEAKVAQIAASLEEVKRGPRPQAIDAAEARLEVAQALQTRARQQYERFHELSQDKGTIAKGELERSIQELRAAEGEVLVRTRELEILREGARKEEIARLEAALAEAEAARDLVRLGFSQEEIDEAEATVARAQAALDVVREQKKELVIRAPSVGVIESLDLQPGDVVTANAPVISMLDIRNLWVRAYVPEDIPLRLDQPVEITVNAYPGTRFAGRITYISRLAEFTPSNVQTPEERAKQVFRVKIGLLTGHDQLRAGMMVDVWLQPREVSP